jgi:hypothetical protein
MDKTKQFIDKANKLHDYTYDYSKVNYTKAIEKVIIICKIHGEFTQSPNNHLKKTLCGCPLCGQIKRTITQSDTSEDFIKKAIKIHGNTYDYSKVEYINCRTNVIIICKIHGKFKQSPTNHLCNKGCNKCGIDRTMNIRTQTTLKFIENAKKVHNESYDYSKVIYTKAIEKVIIICKIHGDFLQTPHDHLAKKGCNECGTNRTTNIRTDTIEDFIKKAVKTHGNTYDYSKVEYIKSTMLVKIICKKHGEFLQTPANHITGNNCSKCAASNNYSKVQIEWLSFIEKFYNISIQHCLNDIEFKIPNTNYKADGYCKETNTIYEFHGDYWHGNPKKFNHNDINKVNKKSFGILYNNTIIRENKIRSLGYNLITMWEYDWNKINNSIKILQLKFRSKYK